MLLELREWPSSMPPGTVPVAVELAVAPTWLAPLLLLHCELLLLVDAVARWADSDGSVAWDVVESSMDDGGSEDSEMPESVTGKDSSRSIDC